MSRKTVRVFIYHSGKSHQMLQRIERVLREKLDMQPLFVSLPEGADVVYGAYMSDDGKHRVLRRLGVK